MEKAEIELGALNEQLRKAGVVLVVQHDDEKRPGEAPTVLRIEAASLHPVEGAPPCEHWKTCRTCPSPAFADQTRKLEDEQRERAEKAEAALLASAERVAELAEVLIAVEWQGIEDYVGDGGYHCCPTCRGIAPEDATMSDAVADVALNKSVLGHKPDCALEAALRKAGVR